MALLREFLNYLEGQAENGSIYVWGAQGQDKNTISESWIRRMETSQKNANRAIAFWRKRKAAGKGEVLRAFDCSGLIMYFLQNQKGVIGCDTTANGLKGLSQKIEKAQLLPGDFVFRVYTDGASKGRAYHVGIVVDAKRNVIEAKGRDDGVVKRGIDAQAGYWNYFGRPECLKEEIEEDMPAVELPKDWVLSRLLKQTSPLMRGEDVRQAQEALIARGYPCGNRGADGQFGKDTENAVGRFQKDNALREDGIIGQDTCKKLGGKWEGAAGGGNAAWTLSRLLKRTSPLMQGEDVRQAQETLIARGYPCGSRGADGQFGDDTEQAVEAFQKKNGLRQDGVIGKDTCERLGGIWKG